MSEPLVALRAGLSSAQAQDLLVLLQALGVPAAIDGDEGEMRVCVAPQDLDRAQGIAREEEARDPAAGTPGAAPGAVPDAAPGAWIGPEAIVVLLLVALCVWLFAWGAHQRGGFPERWLGQGAISGPTLARGELWRLATAVFVHFDGAHLAVNMAALLVLGPPLAVLVGAPRFVAIFLLTGVAGNALSYAIAPTAGLKAGASGAIAGVLGALAGVSLARRSQGRFRRWQILAALAAVYALVIGAGPGSDHVAHLGGLLAGVPLGFLADRHAARRGLSPPSPRAASPDRASGGSV